MVAIKPNGFKTQAIRLPAGSYHPNLRFVIGAGKDCKWPTLRGGVLKCGVNRTEPLITAGPLLEIGIGWVLMDSEAMNYTRTINDGIVPSTDFDMPKESLYLVHASFTHPREIFLPAGTWTNAELVEDVADHVARDFTDLVIPEERLKYFEPPELVERIVVLLSAGGKIVLRR